MLDLIVSPKHQVVIPKKVRQVARIRAGDKVRVYLEKGNKVVIKKQSKSLVDEMYGIGADLIKSLGGTDAYIERERNSWD